MRPVHCTTDSLQKYLVQRMPQPHDVQELPQAHCRVTELEEVASPEDHARGTIQKAYALSPIVDRKIQPLTDLQLLRLISPLMFEAHKQLHEPASD